MSPGSSKGELRGRGWLQEAMGDESRCPRAIWRIRRILLIFVNDKGVYIAVHAVCTYMCKRKLVGEPSSGVSRWCIHRRFIPVACEPSIKIINSTVVCVTIKRMKIWQTVFRIFELFAIFGCSLLKVIRNFRRFCYMTFVKVGL